MGRPPRPVAERFWSKVRKTDGCWLWIAGKHRRGYGKFRVGADTKPAHVVSWTLEHGHDPSPLFVCHSCDNTSCVRPSHLFLGTPAVNSADMRAKGRQAHGETHHSTKLSAKDVRTIQTLLLLGCSYRELGRDFNVSKTLIRNIDLGKHWSL